MHNILFIRRRFPNHSGKIITAIFIITTILLATGIGLALLF